MTSLQIVNHRRFFAKIPGNNPSWRILKTIIFQTEWSKTKSHRTVYPFWASVRRIKTDRSKNFEKEFGNHWINARQLTFTVTIIRSQSGLDGRDEIRIIHKSCNIIEKINAMMATIRHSSNFIIKSLVSIYCTATVLRRNWSSSHEECQIFVKYKTFQTQTGL